MSLFCPYDRRPCIRPRCLTCPEEGLRPMTATIRKLTDAQKIENKQYILFRIVDGEIRDIDIGGWEVYPGRNDPGGYDPPFQDWTSNRGIEEPTHYMEIPSIELEPKSETPGKGSLRDKSDQALADEWHYWDDKINSAASWGAAVAAEIDRRKIKVLGYNTWEQS